MARVLGGIAVAIFFVQFIPQIVATFRIKDPGSVSILTQVVQVRQIHSCPVAICVRIVNSNDGSDVPPAL
jgi:uncharacterized protein with PQ loop repeat